MRRYEWKFYIKLWSGRVLEYTENLRKKDAFARFHEIAERQDVMYVDLGRVYAVNRKEVR